MILKTLSKFVPKKLMLSVKKRFLLFLISCFFINIYGQKANGNYPYRILYVVFPLDIFNADYPDGPPANAKILGPQTINLLKYCKINHFGCIMFNNLQVYRPIDKIEHPCIDTINGCCASGVLVDGWKDYFAEFIKQAKTPIAMGGYGLVSIGAEIRELAGDEFYGDIRCSVSDLDAIVKFDKEHPHSRIDQVDIDYEFDLPQYSKFKLDNQKNKSNISGYNYNLDPFCNCNSIPLDNANTALIPSNEFVSYGFRKFQEIIGHAKKIRQENPLTIDTISVKIENMEENFVDDGSIPPIKINPNVVGSPLQCRYPKDSKLEHCQTNGYSRSLTQALYFADWIAQNVDKAGLDLTTSDGTNCNYMPKEVPFVNDSNGCKSRKPDYFLNNGVDNESAPRGNAISPPTVNYDKPYQPFSNSAKRQRWLDYFGSVKSDKKFVLFPRMSTQPKNSGAGYSAGLGDWMTQMGNWDCTSDACNGNFVCCDMPHYIPDIEVEFITQYKSSFNESFNQFNKNLDHDGSYYYDEHYKFTFNHLQKRNEAYWGIYNNIIIDGFGWYRYGFYPLVPDNNPEHGYAPNCYCVPKQNVECKGICELKQDRKHDADATK